MSPAGLRNKLFETITPKALKPVYYEHGREIANGISATRIISAPYLFYTAAAGKKGVIEGVTRITLWIGDGLDGFIAKHDKDFTNAEPTVKSLSKFVGGMASIGKSGAKSSEKLRAAWTLLGDTDGATFDPLTDKSAQEADQAGSSLFGDMPLKFTAGTLVRNRILDASRDMYESHKVKQAGKAGIWGKSKTVAFAVHSTAEAFGVLNKHTNVRKSLIYGGAVLNAVSAGANMINLERQYLANQGYATDPMTRPELLALGAARLLTAHMPNITIEPSYHKIEA